MSDRTFRASDVVSCVDEGEDGAMLYNPDKDDTVLLNPSGRAVWTLLAQPRTLDEIAGQLAAAYPGLEPDRAAKDAQEFLDSLVPDFVTTSADES